MACATFESLCSCYFLPILATFAAAQNQAGVDPSVPPSPREKQIRLKHISVIAQTKGFEHDSISWCYGCHLQHGPRERPLGRHAPTEDVHPRRIWRETQRIWTTSTPSSS